MSKDLSRRRFLKLAGGGSLVVLAATALRTNVYEGNSPRDDNADIVRYLNQEYSNADPNQPDHAYPQNIGEYAELVKKHMPYVSATDPNQKDRVFLSKINDRCGLRDVLDYMEIDMENLTEEQKRDLEEANAYKMLESDEKEHRKFLNDFPWIDYDNITDKDKIWLRKTGKGMIEGLQSVQM